MPAIRRNLIYPESITIHVKNILATLTVRDVWSACIASMTVIGTRTLTCARVQYCLVERWPACNSRTRHEPGRGRRSHGASASARCDVNTSAVARQCFSGFPVNRPLACLRPNGTEHRTGTGADAEQSGCANTETKRRVQHCVDEPDSRPKLLRTPSTDTVSSLFVCGNTLLFRPCSKAEECY